MHVISFFQLDKISERFCKRQTLRKKNTLTIPFPHFLLVKYLYTLFQFSFNENQVRDKQNLNFNEVEILT
jgi:hypothetical protein